ncbi:MAG: S-adenosylmethionine:tRNA ribosyltransferase-isomerase [Chitinophagaceae bacterium]
MNPKNLSISDFTYTLPLHQIAHYPLAERDESKLLLYYNNKISEDVYKNLDQYIDPASLMVFNNTKVIEARLLFQKDTGAVVEVFCLEPDHRYPDITTGMVQKGSVVWNCLIGGASKWKAGQVLEKKIRYQNLEIYIRAKYLQKKDDQFSIELQWSPIELSFAEIVHIAGVMPLPPYIKRTVTPEDVERYQTIYASSNGSVAAPTAGLHFTEALLRKLEEKKILTEFITLHVGAGTFKPVKAASMELHTMHSEFIDVPLVTIERILQHYSNAITAVGTTTARTIESLYWLGIKILLKPTISYDELFLSQWEPYELPGKDISVPDALGELIIWLHQNKKSRLITTTQLLIAPGYDFKIINGLITNFHQPQSTLLLLVAAFLGDDWKKIYQYAIENNFRFLSYGDGCLLQRH